MSHYHSQSQNLFTSPSSEVEDSTCARRGEGELVMMRQYEGPHASVSTTPELSAALAIALLQSLSHPAPLVLGLDFDGVLHHQFAGARDPDFEEKPYEQHDFIKRANARTRQYEIEQWKYLGKIWKNIDPQSTLEAVRFNSQFGTLFDKVGYLEDLIATLAACGMGVEIVFTTSWLERLHWRQLQKFLPASIRHCVVGGTDMSLNITRGERMETWLAEHGRQGRLWIALDDVNYHYAMPAHQPRLVETTRWGMEDTTVRKALITLAALIRSGSVPAAPEPICRAI